MDDKLEVKLKEIITLCDVSIDKESLNESTDLVRDFGFNSVNIIQLLVVLESEFNIQIDDGDIVFEKLSTYKGLLDILNAKVKLNR